MIKGKNFYWVDTSICFFENDKFVSHIDLCKKFNDSKIFEVYYMPDNIFIIQLQEKDSCIKPHFHVIAFVNEETKNLDILLKCRLPRYIKTKKEEHRYKYSVEKDIYFYATNFQSKTYHLCGYYEDQFGLIKIESNKCQFEPHPFKPDQKMDDVLYMSENKFVYTYAIYENRLRKKITCLFMMETMFLIVRNA